MSNPYDNQEQIKMCLYLIGAGIGTAYYSYRQIQKKTKIRNLAKQKISAASAGNLEIEAVAWPFRNIEVNLEGQKIVFRSVEIQKRVRRGKNSHWETVWKKMTQEPFLVFDASGYVLIKPNDEFASLESLTHKTYSPLKLHSDAMDSFDEFYDQSISGFKTEAQGTSGFFSQLFSSTRIFRIIERSVPIGSPLLLHGHFSPEDSARYIHLKEEFKLFKQRASKLLSEKSYRTAMLDKDKDGSVDLQELCNGFQMALKSSVKKDFSITDIKSVGESIERLRGSLSGSEHNPLMIAHGLEEQILSESPIWRNWITLYLSAGLIALAILFIIIL